MTSGKFKTIPISEIFIDRENRQRKAFAVDDLTDSISRLGLINPVVIDKDQTLIAGERRLEACRALGWTAITVQFIEEMDEVSVQLLELEENTRRSDLTWQEQVMAMDRIHEIRQRLAKEENSDWNLTDTAKSIGVDYGDLHRAVNIAEELKAGNKQVLEAPKLSVARGIVERKRAREKASALEVVKAPIKVSEETSQAMSEVAAPPVKPAEVPLLNQSFLDWAPTYDGPKFNFIHCDFPYGVNADKHDQGAGAAFGGYSDSFQVYVDLLEGLSSAMTNVVAESAHLMFWFSLDYYQLTKEALEEMGWSVNPFPLIWYKSDNSGILPDPKRGPRRIYETAFFASRGDRLIVRSVSNLVPSPNTKEIHMSEKPKPMLRKFMSMAVDEYSTVLDPTCGSGNAIAVAKELGAKNYLGLEMDPEFFNNAVVAWRQQEAA